MDYRNSKERIRLEIHHIYNYLTALMQIPPLISFKTPERKKVVTNPNPNIMQPQLQLQFCLTCLHTTATNRSHPQKLRGNLQKKTSIFKDITQIEVDPLPSHPIFDKFIFEKVLIMLTSLLPLEFLTKIMTF